MKTKWTGERLETFVLSDSTLEHLHRYGIAQTFVKGKAVLDIACGEGYGSNLLAEHAESVIGVDISSKAVKEASEKYKKNNLLFKTGSTSQIPLEANSIDVVVSFETIEHHAEHDIMLQEIKRVLKHDGLLIISSPDKENYSDIPNNHNPFHIKELYFDEFKSLVQKNFAHSHFYLQKIIHGSIVIPEGTVLNLQEYEGNYGEVSICETFSPMYNIALASDARLNIAPASIFRGNHIVDHYVKEAIERVKSSARYRIGDFLLNPFNFLKHLK